MKLGTNICHVYGHLLKRFARSEVKGQGHSETKSTFAAEAYISALWRRVLLVPCLFSAPQSLLQCTLCCRHLSVRLSVCQMRGL